MNAHEDLKQLALDYLYGLLDGPEAAAAQAKLDTVEGREAIAEAQRFRSVLSTAAKLQFPDVKFAPPSEILRNGRRGNMRWVGWVIAASIMGAIAIPGSAAYIQGQTLARRAEFAQAKAKSASDEYAREVEKWKTQVVAANNAKNEAASKYSAVANDYLAALSQAESEIKDKQLNVVVSGPAAMTPGAPNHYLVETKNSAGQLTPAKLSARVVDQNRRVVYEPPAVESRGTFTLKLPVDLPLTPDRDLELEIDAVAKEGAKAELKQKLALAAPVYLSHLTTDKPLYQPGETVRFRALLLDRFKLEPPTENLVMTLSVLDPSGAELFNSAGTSPKALAGIASGEFALPDTAPGGEYTVRLRESRGRTPEQKRKFLVNKYQPARLEKKLEFTRKSYGPGDEVTAACTAARVSGPLANQPVSARAQIDGVSLPVQCASTTDDKGGVLVKFRLPANIDRGAASVSIAFTDGGAQETLVKPVPVVLKKLLVEFYPEGGDLIAGVPNRVYVQARTPLGKPAEMRGRIVDDKGETVADVATLSDDVEPGINQGQAQFTIKPTESTKYQLIVDKPEGIVWKHELPEAKSSGVVLNTGVGVTMDRDPLQLNITNVGLSRKLVVGAYARGRLLDHQRLQFAPNQAQSVTLQAAPGFGGVTRVTVFEETGEGVAQQLVPVAERLVFRQPTKKVELTVAADKTAYAPGDNASLKVTAKDESGKSIPAVAMLGVVNQSVVVMADEKSHRSMPTHFLLTGEVEKAEDLEHVDVLLGQHTKSAQALDLLLGVQGWRRFVEQGPELPTKKGRRETVMTASAPRVQMDSFQAATIRVSDSKAPEFAQVQTAIESSNQALQAAMVAPPTVIDTNQQFREAAVVAVKAMIANYNFAAKYRELVQSGMIFVGITIVGVAALAAMGAAMVRKSKRCVLSAMALGCVCIALVGWMMSNTADVITFPNPTAIAESEDRPPSPPPTDAAPTVPAPVAQWDIVSNNNWKLVDPTNETLSKLVLERQLQDDQFRIMLGRKLNLVDKELDEFARQASALYKVTSASPSKEAELRILDLAARPSSDLDIPKRDGSFQYGIPPVANAAPKADRGGTTGETAAAGRAGGVGGDMKPGTPAARELGDRAEPAPGPTAGLPGDKMSEKPGEAGQQKSGDVAKSLRRGIDHDMESREPLGGGRGGIAAPGDAATAKTTAGEKVEQVAKELGVGRVVSQPNQPVIGLIRENTRRERVVEEKNTADNGSVIDAPNEVFNIAGLGRARPIEEILAKYSGGKSDTPAFFNPAWLAHPTINRPFIIREYAHVHKPAADGIRDDFTETVYWHPALIVPGEGVSVKFDLSDSVNRYQILVAAHTADGRLGATKGELTARKPLNVEPKLPVEITAGDRLDVAVAVSNETDKARDVKLSLETPGLLHVGEMPSLTWSQAANSRSRRVLQFISQHVEGTARLRFALAGEDSIEMKLPVVPDGFPVQGQFSDELRGAAKHNLKLPATWVPGTLKCEVVFFPTPLADLQRGLEGLLREPYGCFEQTSTTNYPNTLILDYLRETNQANPEMIARAKGMLDRGYSRLVAFEVPAGSKKEGYEWFGHAPAHEALTAYGLLQFRDMARVADVDQAMLARTREYLMARRDGQGGFQRSRAALDGFGRASDSVTNAYIVWAITEGDKIDDVNKELDRLQNEAKTSDDPYFLALVANALLNRDKTDAATGILARLVKMQHADGSLSGSVRSITGSQGEPLKIETTALAILAWLKSNQPSDYGPSTRKAIQWIGRQRQGGGSFGPTQSTILALKSLIAFARVNKQPPESGTMKVQVGERSCGSIDYNADRQDAIVIEVPNAEEWLKPGDNAVTISTTGKNNYPYTVGWSYRTLQPLSAEGCAVRLETKLDRTDLAEGDSTRLNVSLENVSKQGQGMTIAIIGLPAGLKLPDDFKQLRDLSRIADGKPGVISYFEVRGRELVLYWRDLAPDAKINLQLDVIAHVPGQYRGPASRAYLYYDPAAKHWVPPMGATIAAK